MARRQTSPRRYVDVDDISMSGLAETSRNVLLVGLDLGWSASIMRNGVVRLTRQHEGREVAINLPSNQRSIKESVARSWMRKVFTYADPLQREMVLSAVEDYRSPNSSRRAAAQAVMNGLRSTEVFKDPENALGRLITVDTTEGEMTLGEAIDEAVRRADDLQEPEQAEAEQPEPEPEPEMQAEDAAEIVKVRPWVARHTMRQEGGEVYHSRAVLERKWSDGTTDYQCSRCEYTSPEARSVAAHYGGKHGRDFPARQDDRWVDPQVTWVPTERQRGRIRRLADEIAAAREVLGDDAAVLAIAEWIVKRRDEERESLTDEATPLTDEQVLERIRRLVDRGAYADLLARIEQVEAEARAKAEQAEIEHRRERTGAANAIRVLESRVEEAERRAAAAAEAEAAARSGRDEMEARWKALRELLQEEG